jgi:O-antigen/teichoic acid export membrane protein
MLATHVGHPTTTVYNSLSRNVLVAIGARLGYVASRFFVPPFVLAHVSLEAYGLWSAAFVLVSYLGISTFGVSNVYVKYVADYVAAGEYRRANALLSTGLAVTSSLCLALFLLLCLQWSWIITWVEIPSHLAADAQEVVFLVISVFLASLTLSVFGDALTGAQQLATVQKVWVVAYLVETALILMLVHLGRGIRGLAEAFVVRIIIESGLAAWFAFYRLPWLQLSPRLCSRDALRKLVSFGGTVQFLGCLAIILGSIERTLTAFLVGLRAVGLIELSKKLPGMASLIPSSFLSSFVPAASYLYRGLTHRAEEAQREIARLYLKGARYMNLSAAAVTGVLAAAPEAVLRCWLGKDYTTVSFLLVIFAVSMQIHLLTGPGTAILKGIGRPREEFFYALPNILFLLIAIPLSHAFLGHWSGPGIGTAVAISTILAASVFITRANRLLHIPARDFVVEVLMPGVLPYLAAFATITPFTSAILHSPRLMGIAILGAVGCLYGALLTFCVYRFIFSREEQLWLLTLIHQRLRFFPLKRRTVPA